MMRNLPPKGVAGLHRCAVRSLRRSPRPPAMTTASVPLVRRLTYRPEEARTGGRDMSGRYLNYERGELRPQDLAEPITSSRSHPFHQAHLVRVRQQLVMGI